MGEGKEFVVAVHSAITDGLYTDVQLLKSLGTSSKKSGQTGHSLFGCYWRFLSVATPAGRPHSAVCGEPSTSEQLVLGSGVS